MNRPAYRHLRRVQAFVGRPSEHSNETSSSTTDVATSGKVRMVVRVFLKSPWDDYSYIRRIGQTILTRRNASSFQLLDIREVLPLEVLCDPSILSKVKHPNIATIEELYCHDDKVFLVMEHLDVSFAELQYGKFDLEEREIATILKEVLKGLTHIFSLRLSCKELTQEHIQLSLDGDIKLVLTPRDLDYNDLHESPKVSQVLLDFPILAEIIEEMMLSRYHLTEDEKWSKDALDFLSCTLEGSFESLMKHCFLRQAVSPRRLIPRIRFAYETKRESWNLNSAQRHSFNFGPVSMG